MLDLAHNLRSCPFSDEERSLLLSGWPDSVLTDYPDVVPLRNRLGQFLRTNPENLLVTPGADTALRIAFDAFVNETGSVLRLHPTYRRIRHFTNIRRAGEAIVRHDAGMRLDPATLRAAIRADVSMLAIANPNASSNALSRDEIAMLAQEASRHGARLLVDETYLVPGPDTAVSLIPDLPNLIVVASMSKYCGLAGVRLGYITAAPDLIEAMSRYALKPEISGPAAEIGMRLLDNWEIVTRHVARLDAGRAELIRGLSGLDIEHMAGEANFVVARLADDAQELAAWLRERHDINLCTYPDDYCRFVRITLGPVDQMQRVVRALAEWTDQQIGSLEQSPS